MSIYWNEGGVDDIISCGSDARAASKKEIDCFVAKFRLSMYACISHTAGWTSTGVVINPARGQLNRDSEFSLSPFAP